jgi:hypothetical protein
MGRRFKARGLLFVSFALLVVAAGLAFAFRSPPLAPVIVVSQPYQLPAHQPSLFNRLVPIQPSWAWLWRLKQAVVRPAKVNVECRVTAFPNGPDLRSALVLNPPDFTATNGVQVWLLGDGELKRLRSACESIPGAEFPFAPRISTADGIEASLFSGSTLVLNCATNETGLMFNCFPRVYRDRTIRSTVVRLSETVTNEPAATAGAPVVSLRTNLALAARVQIPRNGGVFLLDAAPGEAARRRMGVIISAKVPAK